MITLNKDIFKAFESIGAEVRVLPVPARLMRTDQPVRLEVKLLPDGKPRFEVLIDPDRTLAVEVNALQPELKRLVLVVTTRLGYGVEGMRPRAERFLCAHTGKRWVGGALPSALTGGITSVIAES